MIALVAASFCDHRRQMHDNKDPAAQPDRSIDTTGLAKDVVPPPLRTAVTRTALRISVLALLAVIFHAILGWLLMQLGTLNSISGQTGLISLMVLALVGYAILIAIPFMPGIEIGIALLLLQGSVIAPFVYLATVLGLMLAYTIGSRVPLKMLHDTFRDLNMRRACALIAQIKTTPAADRLDRLQDRLPAPLAKLTGRYRYVMLGVLINIPGSFAIGGGGGIMMLAGVVRLFDWPVILLTLMVATLPIPLVVYLFGATALRDFFA